MSAKSYAAAVADVAGALDAFSQGVVSDVCGVKPVADLVAQLVPSLRAAIVKVETSGAVHIIVGAADVYIPLYDAAQAIQVSSSACIAIHSHHASDPPHTRFVPQRGDFAGLGMALGQLLQMLRSSGCQTPACLVLQGLLASAQIEVGMQASAHFYLTLVHPVIVC
jgi:hypothetical protein